MNGQGKAIARDSRCDRQSGFTLIELLVSLTLLAVIIAFIPGTLRIGQRVWEKEDAVERRAALSTFRRYLEQRLAEAMPIHARDGAKGLRIAFTGGPDHLAFIAPAEAGPAGGGVYRFSLRRGDGAGEQPLVLTQTLYRAANEAAGMDAASAAPAMEYRTAARPTRLAFSYFGAVNGRDAPRWHEQWLRADSLPDLVAITLVIGGGAAARTERIVVPLRLKTP